MLLLKPSFELWTSVLIGCDLDHDKMCRGTEIKTIFRGRGHHIKLQTHLLLSLRLEGKWSIRCPSHDKDLTHTLQLNSDEKTRNEKIFPAKQKWKIHATTVSTSLGATKCEAAECSSGIFMACVIMLSRESGESVECDDRRCLLEKREANER